jgi:hypothetical protein
MEIVKVIEIRPTRKPGPLKAFADIEIEGLLLRDFRIYQVNGKPTVRNPFSTYKDQMEP